MKPEDDLFARLRKHRPEKKPNKTDEDRPELSQAAPLAGSSCREMRSRPIDFWTSWTGVWE